MGEGGWVAGVGGGGAATTSSSLSARLTANLLNPDKCEYKSRELRWQSVRGGELGRRPLHCTGRDSYLPGCTGPTAAMWRVYERYCHRGTLMMAINNNIAMSYLSIWFFFSVLPSLKEGTEGEGKGRRGGRARREKDASWNFHTAFLILESGGEERKAIKRDQSLHALALLEERAAGASVGSSVERSRDERWQPCVASTYMWVVTSGTESLAFPTLNAKVSKIMMSVMMP